MRWPWTGRVCLLGTLLAAPLTLHAQVESREGIALQNQIYQLRQDLQYLRSDPGRTQNYGGGGPAAGGDIAAQLLGRVQALEEQVRQLRGRIDETQNQITRQNAELSKRIDDLAFQLNLPGKSGALSPPLTTVPGPAPPPVREVTPRPPPDSLARPDLTPKLAGPGQLPGVIPPPPPPPQSFTFNQTPEPMREVPPREVPSAAAHPADPPKPVARPIDLAPKPAQQGSGSPPGAAVEATVAAVPSGGKRTPELALQEGNAALARRDYPAAERAAREVMANRASPRAYDGQFLLAQSLSGQKQFAQAAIAFDDTYSKSKRGRYAQASLVGLAGALTAINEKKAACDTLGRLRTEFPQVRADLQETITRTNERAGCGR